MNVAAHIAEEPGLTWFALLDASALVDGRAGLRRSGFANMRCLFDGDLEIECWDAAPYLAQLPDAESMPDNLQESLNNLASQDAVILVGTNGGVDLSELRRHFKKFNLVYLPDGEPVFFRYFDPRVFLAAWPHLHMQQKSEFLREINLLLVPDAKGGQLVSIRPTTSSNNDAIN